MGYRISSENAIATPYRPVARASGAAGFTFDPENWVELAYECSERRLMGPEGKRVPFQASFTAEGLEKMVQKFRAAREADPEHALLVNLDHLAMREDQKTEAAAWLTDLKVEGGRLYGRFKWTTLGEELARGGVYRFVSVEVDSDETPRTDWPSKGVVWDRLDGVAITNDHALKGLKPFCHRADGDEGEEIEKENKPKGHTMEAIKEMLGLAPDATEEQVAEAIQALKGQVETYTAEKAEAETKAKAEAFSQKYGDRFKDEDAAEAFYRANPEHAEELAESVKVVEKVVTKEVKAPVAHRGAGTPAKAEDKTPLGIYRKYRDMPEGEEKGAFLRAHATAINEGATLAEQEAGE